MDIDTLKAELDTDPLGRGYAAMSDEEAAASLNVKDQTRDRFFGIGSETITALKAARVETISRGVKIGIGLVKPGNVQEARV